MAMFYLKNYEQGRGLTSMIGGGYDATTSNNLDEPTKLAFYLHNCAKKFLSSESIQVLPAIKCLYMALSMVLAPQIEVEFRLMLGNVLLDHTRNFNEALEQIQKAHQLAETVNFSKG